MRNEFPFILPCSSQSNDHSACLNIKSKNMYLGMILNIGYKRPLNKEVIKNIELLRKDPEHIDECWANIAASAVQPVNSKNTIKRICVPLISIPLIQLVKFSVENAYIKIDIETDVKCFVNDIVDYVERNEMLKSLDFPYDRDVQFASFPENYKPLLKKCKKSKLERELGRLMDHTLVEQYKINSTSFGESECGKAYCSKGCVCHSLNGSTSIHHCGKERCMFNCLCKNRGHKNKLTKEESLRHKIESEPHNYSSYTFKAPYDIPKPSNTDKCFTKPPNEIPTDKPYTSGIIKNDSNTAIKEPYNKSSNEELSIPDHQKSNSPVPDGIPPDWELEACLEIEEVVFSTDEEECDELSPICDPFIWCTIHRKHNCPCENAIQFLKANIFWKRKSFYKSDISRKQLSKVLSGTFNFSKAHSHDICLHSARTSGIPFDFCSRNKSEGFKNKRKMEMKNGIMSNTNSLFKVKARKFQYFKRNIKSIKMDNNVINLIDTKNKNTPCNYINVVRQNNFLKDVKVNKVSFDLKCLPKKEMIKFVCEEKATESNIAQTKYRIGPAHIKPTGRITAKRSQESGRFIFYKPSEGGDVPQKEDATTPSTSAGAGLLAAGPPPVHNSYQEINATLLRQVYPYGLCCLTEGFGYLPVECFTPEKISVRDPIADNIYHAFKDLHSANAWLNRYFKSKMLFEDINFDLRWVLIKLALTNMVEIFDKRLIQYNTKVVNKHGILVDKNDFKADSV